MRNALKALSLLLTYPTKELQEAADGISGTIARESAIPAPIRAQLSLLIREFASGDLYDMQERYVLLFDRTRSLSLHLFEHVHGESRDRGQAMVDLQNLYGEHGLEIGAGELPDFLPLFLEFLSTLPVTEAHEHLTQPVHVLTAIAERLHKRSSPYESVFRALLALAGTKPKQEEVTTLLELPDPEAEDLAALDSAWEDEPVNFGPGATCGDGIATRIRAARRPAAGMEQAAPASRTVFTTSRAGER